MKAPLSTSSGAPAITTFLPDSHKRIQSSPKFRSGHSLTIHRALVQLQYIHHLHHGISTFVLWISQPQRKLASEIQSPPPHHQGRVRYPDSVQ